MPACPRAQSASVAASAGVILAATIDRGPSSALPATLTPKVEAPARAAWVLACPPFEARGVPEPAGWLGAAAATLACNRAQLIMGGRSERTLVPAELLDLPRAPVDDFPRDPFGLLEGVVRPTQGPGCPGVKLHQIHPGIEMVRVKLDRSLHRVPTAEGENEGVLKRSEVEAGRAIAV